VISVTGNKVAPGADGIALRAEGTSSMAQSSKAQVL